jgi:hypothetical protein
MSSKTIDKPKHGFAIEVDRQLKTQFATKVGAEFGASELKRRFPMLQIRIFDTAAHARHELPV